jgi:hypothetical protein
MKKQEDVRLAVLREYDRWAKDHPNDAKKMGGFVFFGYLEKERPDLLDFRAVGDEKWQIFTAGFAIGWKINLSSRSSSRCPRRRLPASPISAGLDGRRRRVMRWKASARRPCKRRDKTASSNR